MSANRFVRRTWMAGKRRGREFSLEWGDQSRVREVRVWYTAASDPGIAAVQVIWEADDRRVLRSPILGQVDLDPDGQPLPHDAATLLGDDDVINGLYGHHRGGSDRINSIGIITQDGPLELIGSSVGNEYRWTLVDMPQDGMPDALVTGLFGYYDRSGLRGIGLRCTIDGVGPLVLPWGPDGRVIPAVDVGKPPHVDDQRVPSTPAEQQENAGRLNHVGDPTPETMRPNPNHRRIDVRRIDQWDDILRIYRFNGYVDEFYFVERGIDQKAQEWTNVYRDADNHKATVHIGSGDAWIELSDGTPFTKPALPQPAASDGPTWDNVFSLDHRVDYLAWALRGLDISRLAPFNFQESNGVLQQDVFRAPQPGSRDFHIAANGKATVVPNGWMFVGDVSGSTKARTTSTFSDEESRQSWATSLGISAEADAFGAKVAYKGNSKAHAELNNASSGKTVSTISETMELSHSLVVDLATVELADGFRRAVNELKTDPSQQRIVDFLRRFGTHYAHAVTFGSKSWEQRHETDESVTDGVTAGTSQDQSVEVGYHNEVGGAGGSVSWGSQNEASLSTKKGTGSDVSSSGSVGSPSEPVPILLEVEELTHLLSPVFFDDPYVYVTLRDTITHLLYELPGELLDELIDYDDDPGTGLSFAIAQGLHAETWDDRLYDLGSGPALWVHTGLVYELTDVTLDYLGGPANFEDPATLLPGSPTPEQDVGLVLDRAPRSRNDPTREGKAFRCTDDRQAWWIRGGRRHHVADPGGDFDFLPVRFAYWSDEIEERDKYIDSGEPVTVEGKMLRAQDDSREVWWIRNGKRHIVPSEVVASVLGGWELVATVDPGFLDRFERSNAPTSVTGKMVSLYDKVWVIHQQQRHLIANELGVRKRGGWQQVAIVRRDVLNWFPDSGKLAL